jgi:hypothetical protein
MINIIGKIKEKIEANEDVLLSDEELMNIQKEWIKVLESRTLEENERELYEINEQILIQQEVCDDNNSNKNRNKLNILCTKKYTAAEFLRNYCWVNGIDDE